MVIIINKRFRVFLDECIINLYLLVYVCIHQWINKSKLYIDKIMSIPIKMSTLIIIRRLNEYMVEINISVLSVYIMIMYFSSLHNPILFKGIEDH